MHSSALNVSTKINTSFKYAFKPLSRSIRVLRGSDAINFLGYISMVDSGALIRREHSEASLTKEYLNHFSSSYIMPDNSETRHCRCSLFMLPSVRHKYIRLNLYGLLRRTTMRSGASASGTKKKKRENKST